MLTPDIGPPRAGRSSTKNRAFLVQGEFPRGERGGGDLAMFFMFVAVLAQFFEQGVGGSEGGNGFGREERRHGHRY